MKRNAMLCVLLALGVVGCAANDHPEWNTYHLGWFVHRRAHHVSTSMDAWNQNYQVTGYDDSGRVIWFRAGVPSVTVTLGHK